MRRGQRAVSSSLSRSIARAQSSDITPYPLVSRTPGWRPAVQRRAPHQTGLHNQPGTDPSSCGLRVHEIPPRPSLPVPHSVAAARGERENNTDVIPLGPSTAVRGLRRETRRCARVLRPGSIRSASSASPLPYCRLRARRSRKAISPSSPPASCCMSCRRSLHASSSRGCRSRAHTVPITVSVSSISGAPM